MGSSYKNDTVPEVNGKDALDAMKAIFAALESSESGQTGGDYRGGLII